MKTFFVTGLPRTRTAWLANFFTYQTSFCFHEAFNSHSTIGGYVKTLDKMSYDYVGNSDCSLPLMIDGLMDIYPESKIVVIERDAKEVYGRLMGLFLYDAVKLEKLLSVEVKLIEKMKQKHQCLVVQFNDINKSIKTIWEHCLPGIEFNQERYELLKELNVAIIPASYVNNINLNSIIVKEVEKCQL